MWAMRGVSAAGVLVAEISLLPYVSADDGPTLDVLGYGPLSLLVCSIENEYTRNNTSVTDYRIG